MRSGAGGSVVATLRNEILGEAEAAWGVPRRAATAAFLIPIIGGVVVVASRAHSGLFRFLTMEDGIVEWVQVLGFLAASVGGALLAIHLARSQMRLAAFAFVAFAVGCFFIAGEEIAWGQRIFGIETPESFAEINKQGETTIHNIDGILVFFNLGMLVAGLLGAVLPWVARRRDVLRSTAWRLSVPPLFLTSAFFVMFAYKAIRFTVLPQSQYTIVKIGEWAELCLGLALAGYVWLQWKREREVQDTTGATLRSSQAASVPSAGVRDNVPATSPAHQPTPTTPPSSSS